MQQGEFSLSDRLSRKDQGCLNILGFEVGQIAENLLLSHAFRHHADDGCHRNAKSADTRHPVHLFGINGDAGHDSIPKPTW